MGVLASRTRFAFLYWLALFGGSVAVAQLSPSRDSAAEDAIARRDDHGNGIYLQAPKVYDDTSLQIMLNSARSQLSAVSGVSQTGLLGSIGAITGATSVQNSFGAQLGGPTIPQTQATSNGPTSQTATVTGGTPSVTVTNTAPNQSTVTTTTPPTIPTVSLPSGGGFTPPTSFSGNALNTLNEQMQLTYEIANLELLLEGSLSDRFIGTGPFQKPRSTVGFPITITPPSQYKEAVAVVEVEVERPRVRLSPALADSDNDPPAVTALLPRERTFNVAAITNNQGSVGAGFVTGVLGGSFSFLHGRSTYYVVQDQDTVALQLPSSSTTTAFAWQFKPVLGQSYVQAGMRQTFVQLAMPVDDFAGCFGTMTITTYWRRFNKKTGMAGELIPDSLRRYRNVPIRVFDTMPLISPGFEYEDLGNGQVEVRVPGQFMTGTYVRVGTTLYQPDTPGFTLETKMMRFTAAAADLLKTPPHIVSRTGEEFDMIDPEDPQARPPFNRSCTEILNSAGIVPPDKKIALQVQDTCGPTTATPIVNGIDSTTSLLTVLVNGLPTRPDLDKYMLFVTGHVFGLKDAPINRTILDKCQRAFQAAVPTQLLISTNKISVAPLLWKDRHTVQVPFFEMPFGSAGDKIVLLEKDDTNATFLLVGNRLDAARIIDPSSVMLKQYPMNNVDPYSNRSIASFQLPIKTWKNYKSILVSKSTNERVESIDLPNPDDKAAAAAGATLTPKFRVIVGGDEADFTGADLDKIKTVKFGAKELTPAPTLSDDKKALVVKGLNAAGVTLTPFPKELTFLFQDGHKATATIDVVNYRVEPVQDGAPAPKQ